MDLKNIATVQCLVPVPAACQNGGEFCVDDDPAIRWHMIRDNVDLHCRQDAVNVGRAVFDLPIEPCSGAHAPSPAVRRCHIAVANLELATEVAVCGDSIIQGGDPAPDVPHQRPVEVTFPHYPFTPRLSESRIQGDESEAAAERWVRKTPRPSLHSYLIGVRRREPALRAPRCHQGIVQCHRTPAANKGTCPPCCVSGATD